MCLHLPSKSAKCWLVNTSYMDPMAYKSRPEDVMNSSPPPPSLIQCVFYIERKSAPRMAFNWAGESLHVYPDEKVFFCLLDGNPLLSQEWFFLLCFLAGA